MGEKRAKVAAQETQLVDAVQAIQFEMAAPQELHVLL